MFTQPGSDDRTQDELLNDLRYGTPREQEAALARLAAIGEADALDAVIDYLREHAAEASRAGLDALRVLANKYLPEDRYSLAEALIPFLAAEDWEQRLIAVRLINTYPNELAIEPIRALIDEAREKIYAEQHVRLSPGRMLAERTLGEAIIALANSGRLLVLPDILEMLEDPSLRVVAARALGVIGSETERPRLEDLIEDDDPRVRDSAQWALALMDERMEQFLNPPPEFLEPPPDRLNPIYWAHRQLRASEDGLLQYLIVRIAIEHLILDTFVSEGRVPEQCLIIVRRYEGDTPPPYRFNDAPIIGIWEYRWQGPLLRQREGPLPPNQPRFRYPGDSAATITISYPEALEVADEGLVSFDCRFEPFFGRGWIYRVAWREEGWTFSVLRRTWAS